MTFNPKELHWEDITSELFEGKSYFNHISNKKEFIMHQSNYQFYQPNMEIIDKINKVLSISNETFKILTLGASWCKTCAHVKSLLIKIIEKVNNPKIKIYLLGGVKSKLSKARYVWANKSPQEFNNPKFGVKSIPMVYIFDDDGNCLVQYVKYPQNNITYEETILNVIQKKVAKFD